MRILLTGATGFIGSALRPTLERAGYEVWTLERPVASRHSADAPRTVWADLRHREGVEAAVRSVEPQVVVHLAALSAVTYSFEHPEEVLAVNLGGTMLLANAALSAGARFIHASSSEVYGRWRAIDGPIPETAPLAATSPYAASKIAAEYYLKYLESRGLRLTIIRPFNTYGRANIGNRHFVVEKAITQALETQRIELGDPSALRDWVWREDHAKAYLRAVGDYRWEGKTVNVATGQAYSIEQTAILVRTLTENYLGKDVTLAFGKPDRPSDVPYLCGDASLARRLGWTPTLDLAHGLDIAITEWAARLGVPHHELSSVR